MFDGLKKAFAANNARYSFGNGLEETQDSLHHHRQRQQHHKEDHKSKASPQKADHVAHTKHDEKEEDNVGKGRDSEHKS